MIIVCCSVLLDVPDAGGMGDGNADADGSCNGDDHDDDDDDVDVPFSSVVLPT